MDIRLQKLIEGKVYNLIQNKSLMKTGDTIGVAVSGGPDSICLLDILWKMKERLGVGIVACHFNHRLRGEDSDADERFVTEFCDERGIECIVDRAPAKNLYKNEAEARVARYALFEKILREGSADKIALAHHLNDLAETTLLRLIRGTGLSGLRSIPVSRENFIRPLLSSSRSEIESYLAKKNLAFRTDLSNDDLAFTRNFIRHKVLPLIQQINPSAVATVSGYSATATEDYDFIETEAKKAYEEIRLSEESGKVTLDHKKWLLLHPAIKKMTLRLGLLHLHTLLDISSIQIEAIVDLLNKGEGKKHKMLPHSLRAELANGKIILSIK